MIYQQNCLRLWPKSTYITHFTELFNVIYDTGYIPKDKKSIAKECNENRTIRLMCHTLKILLKIIHTKIDRKAENCMS